MKVLIVEDNLNDIKYYQPLESIRGDISFLFLTFDSKWTSNMVRDHIELLYDKTFLWIKSYFVFTSDKIKEFLKNNLFDFYIFDGLNGLATLIVKDTNISKEKVAFLSSTTSFTELAQKEGYKAYRKKDKDIDELIKTHLK